MAASSAYIVPTASSAIVTSKVTIEQPPRDRHRSLTMLDFVLRAPRSRGSRLQRVLIDET